MGFRQRRYATFSRALDSQPRRAPGRSRLPRARMRGARRQHTQAALVPACVREAIYSGCVGVHAHALERRRTCRSRRSGIGSARRRMTPWCRIFLRCRHHLFRLGYRVYPLCLHPSVDGCLPCANSDPRTHSRLLFDPVIRKEPARGLRTNSCSRPCNHP